MVMTPVDQQATIRPRTMTTRRQLLALSAAAGATAFSPWALAQANGKRLVYLVSDQRIPFWDIMWRGVQAQARAHGHRVDVFSANNEAGRELKHIAEVLRQRVDGIVLSPTNSSAAATVLKLAKGAGVPVVIADIGAESDDYLSYIASDNFEGSYQLGRILTSAMKQKGWSQASVGIVAIPQRRANGKARTAGFMKALEESGMRSAGMRQQVDFSHQETFTFTNELMRAHPDMRAIWLQGSDRYQAALDAIAQANKAGQVLLTCFDAEPEFLDLIPRGVLVGAGMQQPYRMGQDAVNALNTHWRGEPVPKQQLTPVLAVSSENIRQLLPTIRRNVLGLAE
jgi:ribose transport system substrate-binding protein